ncbi:hypothetical protein RB594_007073 [Gaeumannomyces avenae]
MAKEPSMFPALLSGAAFGAALTAAGVYQPAVITSQLKLQNWHMMQSFLTATAGSVLISALAQWLGHAELPPREFSSVRLLGRADANAAGGALLGCGMALAGACPGTVVPQAALGVAPGRWALAGGVLGGLAWSGLLRPWTAARRRNARAAAAAAAAAVGLEKTGGGAGGNGENTWRASLTVYESLGVSYVAALVVMELVLGAAVKIVMGLGNYSNGPAGTYKQQQQQPVHPVIGGLLIASAQLVSLLARKAMLGSSAAFEDAADYLLWLWRRVLSTGADSRPGSKEGKQPRPKTGSLVFAAGMALGAWVLGRGWAPAAAAAVALPGPPTSGGSAARAALGGFLMIVGSRLAGGCTSGHGISGMSLLSISSMVTIGSAFASGIVLSTGFLS